MEVNWSASAPSSSRLTGLSSGVGLLTWSTNSRASPSTPRPKSMDSVSTCTRDFTPWPLTFRNSAPSGPRLLASLRTSSAPSTSPSLPGVKRTSSSRLAPASNSKGSKGATSTLSPMAVAPRTVRGAPPSLASTTFLTRVTCRAEGPNSRSARATSSDGSGGGVQPAPTPINRHTATHPQRSPAMAHPLCSVHGTCNPGSTLGTGCLTGAKASELLGKEGEPVGNALPTGWPSLEETSGASTR
jgi:hypothetical protein